MDCVGWKESWNRNCVLLSVHAEFREIGLLTSSFYNQPCTKHPAPAPASFPNRNNPQGTQYWLTAVVALRKKKLFFLRNKKKGKAVGTYLIPIIPQWPAAVSHNFGKPSQKLLRAKGTLSLTYSNLFLIYSRERRNSIQEDEDNLCKEEKYSMKESKNVLEIEDYQRQTAISFLWSLELLERNETVQLHNL